MGFDRYGLPHTGSLFLDLGCDCTLTAAALFLTCRSKGTDPPRGLLDAIVRCSYRVRYCASEEDCQHCRCAYIVYERVFPRIWGDDGYGMQYEAKKRYVRRWRIVEQVSRVEFGGEAKVDG